MKNINKQQIANKVLSHQSIRLETVKSSHYWFFGVYMNHYMTTKTADFQKEMFSLTENKDNKTIVIVAARGSAKSTIMGISYPLWAIMGKLEKKYILLVSQTQTKAQGMLQCIKKELESNALLKNDFGNFKEESNQWGSQTLVLPRFNARITPVSAEQAIRGTRHNQHRPDLIIVDDIEDLESVKTQRSRDKTFNWLTGELIPAGDTETTLVVIGNLLHQDSVIKRLEEKIKEGVIKKSVYKAYPLLNENNEALWPSRYTPEKIEEIKGLCDHVTFQREYMLNIIPSTDQIVLEEWLHYYDELPDAPYRFEKIGVDLAISEKETADCTAAVASRTYGVGQNIRIYILPRLVNKRMNFPDSLRTIKFFADFIGKGRIVEILVENVAFQGAFSQQLKDSGYYSKGVSVGGKDKVFRLNLITDLIKNGNILFPKDGAEELITQLLGFGVEKHDDLVDALTLLIGEIISIKRRGSRFGYGKIDKL